MSNENQGTNSKNETGLPDFGNIFSEASEKRFEVDLETGGEQTQVSECRKESTQIYEGTKK